MKAEEIRETITSYLGHSLRSIFERLPLELFLEMEEIRLRLDRPVLLHLRSGEYMLSPDGRAVKNDCAGYRSAPQDLSEILELASSYSRYAFEEELKNGYITIPGGHRIGIAGRMVIENGGIKTIRNISALNIRIARQITGCADEIIPMTVEPELMHTMIISPPACGKTTLLRDLIRQISTGISGRFPGRTVGVVDERSELAGSWKGAAQNDLGPRTDVLDACPKVIGMTLLLRAMSPEAVAVDEIGRPEEIHAITDIMNAGIKIICTVHGRNLEEIRNRAVFKEILDRNVFQRYVILKCPGCIEGVYDHCFQKLGGEGLC